MILFDLELKKILSIIPFENIYPPMNGGMLRCINLLNQLSKYFEVTVIVNQEKKSFEKAFDDYPYLHKCTVFSTKSFKAPADIFAVMPSKLQKALRYRYWNRSLFGPAEESFLLIYPLLKGFLKKKKVDFVILETLFNVEPLAKFIRRRQPDVHIIYNAYNVDSKLAAVSLRNGKISEAAYESIRKAESNLYKFVDGIFTCSELDLAEIIAMNKRILSGTVIPNGVKIANTFSEVENENYRENYNLIFCGSMDYFPNQEGLIWFCKEIFPLIIKQNPLAKLLVVGKGDPGIELPALFKSNSILFLGMVSDVNEYYKKAVVAIVPLLSGSGTRLKLLEAMGNKTAVVSTAIGAEGIGYTDKKNILIANDNISFAKSVIELLDNRALARSIASEAYTFAKKNYEWNTVGEKLRTYIEKARI